MLSIMKDNCTQFRYVAPDELGNWWGAVGPFLMAAEARGGYMNEEQVLYEIMKGSFMLFVGMENDEPVGAATVELLNVNGLKLGIVRQMGGNMFIVEAEFENLLKYLKDLGIERVRMIGRRGWSRKLTRWGFKERYVTMEKDL